MISGKEVLPLSSSVPCWSSLNPSHSLSVEGSNYPGCSLAQVSLRNSVWLIGPEQKLTLTTGPLWKFPGAVLTKHRAQGGLNNRHVLSHSLEAGIRDQGVHRAGSFRGLPGRQFRASPLVSEGFLTVFGAPSLVDASPRRLPPPCVPVSKSHPLPRHHAFFFFHLF